jgi:hypothetical protein
MGLDRDAVSRTVMTLKGFFKDQKTIRGGSILTRLRLKDLAQIFVKALGIPEMIWGPQRRELARDRSVCIAWFARYHDDILALTRDGDCSEDVLEKARKYERAYQRVDDEIDDDFFVKRCWQECEEMQKATQATLIDELPSSIFKDLGARSDWCSDDSSEFGERPQ